MRFNKERYRVHIRESIYNRTAPIEYEEWQQLEANSYERLVLYPLMTDACLARLRCRMERI